MKERRQGRSLVSCLDSAPNLRAVSRQQQVSSTEPVVSGTVVDGEESDEEERLCFLKTADFSISSIFSRLLPS